MNGAGVGEATFSCLQGKHFCCTFLYVTEAAFSLPKRLPRERPEGMKTPHILYKVSSAGPSSQHMVAAVIVGSNNSSSGIPNGHGKVLSFSLAFPDGVRTW